MNKTQTTIRVRQTLEKMREIPSFKVQVELNRALFERIHFDFTVLQNSEGV